MAISMTYGSYSFTPVPLISIRRAHQQRGNRDNSIGYVFNLTLNGTLTPLPASAGLVNTDNLANLLRQAFDKDGKLLEIICDSTTIMQVYPSIVNISLNESNNNWVNTIPYTIELEYAADDLAEHPEAPAYIEDYSEQWTLEFIQEAKYFTWDLSGVSNQVSGQDYAAVDGNNPFEARVNRVITAKGKQTWAGPPPALQGSSTSAVDNALSWINTNISLAYDPDHAHAVANFTNLSNSAGYDTLDHMRTHTIDETSGTVTFNESWVILGQNSGVGASARKATEDFTVNIRRNIEDGKVSVSVDGQIQGREVRSYGSALTPVDSGGQAYTNADAMWTVVQDRVFPRAQLIFQQDFSTILNPNPVNKVVGHQPSKGVITYSYEFNDRPCAFITGSLSENFSIVDTHPTDVFAKLTVLGRTQGPILQQISTVTEAVRQVSIEAVMPQPTGCSSITDLDLNKPSVNVSNLLCQFEQQLTGTYDQVFKSADSESWNPQTGRYSRSVAWTYSSCGTAVNTSFC